MSGGGEAPPMAGLQLPPHCCDNLRAILGTPASKNLDENTIPSTVGFVRFEITEIDLLSARPATRWCSRESLRKADTLRCSDPSSVQTKYHR